jgi:parallel beta-helix repeat protein
MRLTHVLRIGVFGLLFVLALVIVQSVPAQQDNRTLTVCPSGCDFSTIQAAINAAQTGDTITVSSGAYAENLTITTSLTLQGADPTTTIIDGSGGVPSQLPVILVQNTENVTITGFTITKGRRGVHALSVKNLHIVKNVLSRNIRQNILWGANDTSGPVVGEILENQILESLEEPTGGFGQGIHIIGNSQAMISNNLIQGNARVGIIVNRGSNAVITGNMIKENGFEGIRVFNAMVEIRDNKLIANAEAGIHINVERDVAEPFASIRPQTIIEGNEIVETKVSVRSGIETFGQFGQGIWANRAAALTITKNTLHRNATSGIQVYGSEQVAIKENTITETQKDGNAQYGFGIVLSDTRNATIEKNTISKNALMGIGLYENSSAAIVENIMTNNNRYGIYADETLTVTTCTGNTISGHSQNLSNNLQGMCR